LVALASSIVGLLFICEALPIVVNGIALFTQSRVAGASILGPDVEHQRLIWSAAAKANVAAGIARLLIGVALIAGPSRLGAAVARIRKELTGTLGDEAASDQRRAAAVETTGCSGRRRQFGAPPLIRVLSGPSL
jgi:hypothetical protein